MILSIFKRLPFARNRWRNASFAEMSQLYATRFLRQMAQSMVSIMVAVLLYQRGYSLVAILLFVAGYYAIRVLVSFLAAYYVAWAGPKRVILVSNFMAVPALVSLTAIDSLTFLSATMFFAFQAISLSLFTIASGVQFSSLKSNHNVGKQLSYMYIIEKIAMAIAPTVGGFVAFWIGPEAAIWLAAILFSLAAIPLFFTPEQIRRRQRVIYRGMSWSFLRPQVGAKMVSGGIQVATESIWPVYVALIVFSIYDNAVYAQLGVLFSISILASIVVTKIYGMVIDRRKGEALYTTGVIANILVNAIRPFVTTPLSVGLVNIGNEAAASAYNMPLTRGEYDIADSTPGYRAAYLSISMVWFCTGATILALIVAGLVWQFGENLGLTLGFLTMSVLTLVGIRNGFPALRS